MYGSTDIDPVVRYYDVSFGLGSNAELPWYIDRAHRFGGPVLDLACGTGRLALRLAREGLAVTAVDQSSGMLDQFRSKLAQEPATVRSRIAIDQQPMAGFQLDSRFRTVVRCDAFFHNLTVEDELACLAAVHAHLEPGGRFLFNLPNPTCEFILAAEQSNSLVFKERGRFPLPESEDTLVVEQAQSGDRVKQHLSTTLRVTRLSPGGDVLEQSESSWSSRYIHRYEAAHLLARAGFTIDELLGDYESGPVTAKGQLIFVAARA